MTEPAPVRAETELDIDELARQAGLTVRTVRMYQEKGLLPPPLRRGRRAAYRSEHLIRLRLVQRLSDRGYSLAAILDLTQAWDSQHGLAHVLGLEGAVVEQVTGEPPKRYTAEDLLELFPADEDLSGLARAVEIGLLVQDGDEFVTANPTMVEAGASLVAAGVPVHAALDLATTTLSSVDDLAARYMQVFMEHVWAPFEAAGEPDVDVPEIAREIREKRALAINAVAASMAHAMERQIDAAIMTGLKPPAT
jgi:DNA-binding transcriptional MerR regulator